MKKKIVITVPHSFCDKKSIVRDCDKVAEKAAKNIAFRLELESIEQKIFLSDTKRTLENDNNRENSRNSKFRKDITKYKNENINEIKCNLDIHSFPAKEYGVDIYFILNKNTSNKLYFKKMFDKLKSNNINYEIYESAYIENKSQNDIITEFGDANIPAILIEFYEKTDDMLLFEICQYIAESFIN